MKNVLSKNSPEVMDYIRQIETARRVDPRKQHDLACDLFDMAWELGNEDLCEYASCVLGDACCKNNEYSQAQYYLNEGVKGLKKMDEYLLLTRCYNELGVIYRLEGHYIASEENFISAIDIAREHRLYIQELIACSNFAGLCYEMGALREALVYHYRALECCGFIEEERIKNSFMINEYARIVHVHSRLGERVEASFILSEMEKLAVGNSYFFSDLADSIAHYSYFKMMEDTDKANYFRSEMVKAMYDCDNFVSYIDEIKFVLKALLEDREFEELEKITGYIESKIDADSFNGIHLSIEAARIKMYELTNQREKMLLSGYNCCKYCSMRQEDLKNSFVSNLQLRTEIIQQKTKNLFLTAAAETDALTGLANRMKLNTVIDELFIMADKEGKNLGVEMMDVDYFKQINDNHGHSMGDALLKEMGKAFKKIEDEKVFVARYGGDEFIIYYYDMTDDEIITVAKRIHGMINKIGKDLNLGNLTVSQGIVNHPPKPLNRAWDYLNAADYALYYVKEHGKANTRLIKARSELETEKWTKVL